MSSRTKDAASPLGALLHQLPARPAPSMDRALDAAAACLTRHGLARTSMTDIAREMGASRTTLYKQFGSVEQAAWALLLREAYRFFDAFGEIVASSAGPRAVVQLTAEFVRFASGHPVVSRLLHDEPAFVGGIVSRNAAGLVDMAAAVVTPLVAAAMDGGMIRRRDPAELAQWMGRLVAMCVFVPPADLDALLEGMLLPLLEP